VHVTTLVPGDRDRHLEGLLVFLDPPRADAAAALRRLGGLGIAVKVVTGDNPAVTVCGSWACPTSAR
jgi:P-type Mg2+ transporter